MRDILNILESVLTEANLGSQEIPANKNSGVKNPKTGQLMSRPDLFLYKVANRSPFTLVNGGEVTIDPKETNKVKAWIRSSPKGPQGVISLLTTDGETVKNTELLKTIEFGSKESETIKLKGSDVFDVTDQDIKDFGNSIDAILQAGGFPARDMYEVLANSPQVKKLGPVGKAVTDMAKQIASGQVPIVPDNLPPAAVKAIELYASEYLGVMGLVYGTTPFKGGSRADFDKFVGTDISDMIVYFPKSISNPLADSFSVVNQDTGHAIKISSKAAGKGAAPALSSVKIPGDVQKKYPEFYQFYEIVTNPQISTFVQPFEVLNYLYSVAPNTVPKQYKLIMPFSADTVIACQESMKTGQPLPPKLQKIFYSNMSDAVKSNKSPDGGKVWVSLTSDVLDAVNKQDAIPNFQAGVIESLGYNFIQLYSNIKGNKLVSEAFWPGKVTGQVKMKSKGWGNKMGIEISPGRAVKEETPVSINTVTTTASDLATLGRKRRKPI